MTTPPPGGPPPVRLTRAVRRRVRQAWFWQDQAERGLRRIGGTPADLEAVRQIADTLRARALGEAPATAPSPGG